jgi:serine/threonine protein phosphatase PrpC
VSKILEALTDEHRPAVWFLGWAFIILVLAGGVSAILAVVGDSWAEICTEKGGEYVTQYLDVEGESVPVIEERCDLP